MDFNGVWQYQILGNTVKQYVFAIGIGVISLILLKITGEVVFSRLQAFVKKTTSHLDDFLVELAHKIVFPVLYLGALYFSVTQLNLNPSFLKLIKIAFVAGLTIQMTKFLLAVMIFMMEQTWFKKQSEQGNNAVSRSILTILRIVIWGLALVFLFDNMGFNVSAIVAGLGVGGVAMALAAQNILGDLFNYFVIFFDRPFEEGDFIVIDDTMGVIENIGIKSTRIRSLDGEQIVISNTNLTNSRIRNFKRMAQRRVLFKLGIIYETPHDQLEKVPGMIRSIIENTPGARFDRAHFKEFADFSLVIEVVYFALSPDYNVYMDTQQKINLAIKKVFEKEKIEFAYPTQLELQKPVS